ncbi:MAG TPA: glycoside hydrolase family 2 TIM barrel-domain containing protein, partial [Chloroflexota bacterium]|nr:glycoside hydrolase family 2 TIM barrel-domain containing protein [Chloroflexota bacterium]
PFLYDCVLTLGTESPDVVRTYFGLREVTSQRWENRPYEYVFLNGEPIYLRGALDQAFHPDGIYTYPSDDAIKADIQAAKDLGLNMLRCHIKINDPRYYYWCDKLGILMMYDLPSCDVYTPTARANWESTFRAALERDYSHPCIFSWILFNETWGLEEHQTPASWQWVKEMYLLAKQLDPSRLIEDNSTNKYDHVLSDLNSWHFYIDNYRRARHHVARVVEQTSEGGGYNYVSRLYDHVDGARDYAQSTAPLLNSEYAALGARGGDIDISYSFKFLTTDLRRHEKICGYVYTQLTDVEWEHNGFLEYDRTAKEFGYEHFVPGMTVADLNAADVVGLDTPPCRTLPPGAEFTAPAFFSHWDHRPLETATLRWHVTAVDRLGERHAVDEGQRAISPRQYGVLDCGALSVRLPDFPSLVTVALTVEAPDGAVRARNYVNVDVHAAVDESPTLEPAVTTQRLPAGGWALAFAPESFRDCSWPNPIIGQGDAKFGGPGAGWVEYSLALPAEIDLASVSRLRLRFEAGARTARSRLGWPDPAYVKPTDYPQTEARKRPSRVNVSLNGAELGTVALPDDPADARGVLSFQAQGQWEFGSYGTLITLEASAESLPAIVKETGASRQLRLRFEVPRGAGAGGLNLYGARAGAYPLNPTILLNA